MTTMPPLAWLFNHASSAARDQKPSVRYQSLQAEYEAWMRTQKLPVAFGEIKKEKNG